MLLFEKKKFGDYGNYIMLYIKAIQGTYIEEGWS
jgi:hypothetical protein